MIGGNNKNFSDLAMFIRVPALGIFFLIRLRFPYSKSTAKIFEIYTDRTNLPSSENLKKLTTDWEKLKLTLSLN